MEALAEITAASTVVTASKHNLAGCFYTEKCKKYDEGMLPNLHFKYKFSLSGGAINEHFIDTKKKH